MLGYRSGLFTYLGQNTSAQKWMEVIEQQVLDAVEHWDKDSGQEYHDGTVLFATSFVAHTGGHTRLLQTYLSQIPAAKLLISGDPFFSERQHFLAEQEDIYATLFDNTEDRIIFNKMSRFSPCAQLELLSQHFSKIRPKVIILFNLTSDLALLMATLIYIKSNKDVQAYYYHHADDFLPFLGSAFHKHIDLDSNQETKCKNAMCRSLIRISVKNRKTDVLPKMDIFTLFSFAPMTKLRNKNYGKDGYADLVSTLSRKGVRFIIATRKGEAKALKDLLVQCGADLTIIDIDEECFDISKYAGLVHAYLDTFPVGGGMSVVDGLSMGIPVMMNAQPGNQIFRDSVLKEFMFAGTAEIMDFTMKLFMDDDFHQQQSRRAHQIFLEFYDETAMVGALNSLIEQENGHGAIMKQHKA